ncbi:MAG: hypothetical protein H7X84_11750 [Verrucomicrobia bacterium]|nr:hypothetical protein [Prolixibacteraceae bacterium]
MVKLKVVNENYQVFLNEVTTVVQDTLTCMFANTNEEVFSLPENQKFILLQLKVQPVTFNRMEINHPPTHTDNLIRFTPLVI